MSWQSRVPAVLDALVSLWRDSPQLMDLVEDGPLTLESPAQEVLSVGHDGGEDGTSTNGVVSPEGFGVEPNREQFNVACLIAVLDGAGDIKAARDRAFEILGTASDALAANHTLDGVVMYANVQDVSLTQQQTDGGALAQVLFGVACDAYTRR